MRKRTYKVYGLVCPIDNCVRYVGVTKKEPELRLRDHCRDKKTNPEKIKWLNELKIVNKKPIILIIHDHLTKTQAERKEIEIISSFRSYGHKLFNIANGGFLPPLFHPMSFDEYRIKHQKVMEDNFGTPLLQFDKSGNLLAEYASESRASRETGVTRSAIFRCRKGKRKTAGGFIWKEKEITNGKNSTSGNNS